MKKRIGLTLRVQTIKEYDEKRDAISQDWIQFFQKLDFLPILIPNQLPDVTSFLNEMKLDGIILSGGDNIGDDHGRDNTENKILNFVISNNIPTLGVCRGMQVINNFFKGSMVFNEGNQHVAVNHNIKLITKSFIDFFKAEVIEVNSFHHNLITDDNLGENLLPFAIHNSDNTIEGFYHNSIPIIGVMWHPERSFSDQNQIRLLNLLYREKLW